jgi:hypothetical protein
MLEVARDTETRTEEGHGLFLHVPSGRSSAQRVSLSPRCMTTSTCWPIGPATYRATTQ